MSLRKIVIYAFSDETQTTSEIGRFVLPLNPESYKRSHQITLENSQNPGSQSNNGRHANTPVEELSLEFTLDNTNTIEGNLLNGVEVSKQVGDFLNLTYKLNGDVRRPNFLKIAWADDFVFDCQLSKADINYTLFRPDGSPLRAKVAATFKEHKAPQIRVSEEGRVSNTQARVENVLQAGNRLVNVVEKAYSGNNNLLEVAKANNVVNLRKPLDDLKKSLGDAPLALPATGPAADVLQRGVEQARGAASAARNAAQDAANAAQGTVAGAQNLAQSLQGGAQNASGAVSNAVNMLKNAANSAQNAAEKAKDAAKSAKSTAQNTANAARNAANRLKNLF
jgi:Contractile injection system tube protein